MIKLLDQFGRILQIAVEKDAGLHGRHFHPASEGHLRAKIARMRNPETCGSVAEISRMRSAQSSGLPSFTKMIS